jgi:hypothetical protein
MVQQSDLHAMKLQGAVTDMQIKAQQAKQQIEQETLAAAVKARMQMMKPARPKDPVEAAL